MLDFPNKAIRLITTEPGGGGDFVTRLIAQGMSDSLGQPVSVDNHAGIIAMDLVLKEAADGYTLLVFAQTFWTTSLFQVTTPYDPVRDFSPITLATRSPLVVVVHPLVAANSIEELIGLANARPGELSYAAGLNGSSSQLAGELFTYMAGVNMVRIPYETGPLGLKDLIAGKVQMMIPSAGTVMPFVRSGKLKALAVTSAQPSTVVPGLPTVAEFVPGYEMVQTNGVFAPAKTPATVITRLNQEIVRFLQTAAARESLLNAGLEAVGSTSEELAAKIAFEMARWREIIKAVGIVAN